MAVKTSSFLVLAAVLLISSAATTTRAFNITRLLDGFPEFSTFNGYLTQTELFRQINHRRTITVLAVNNDAIGPVSGRPLDAVQRILSDHVVLDYYDQIKLEGLKRRSTIVTTLFQASGIAQQMQGFLNVSKASDGSIFFGSAMKGASQDSKLVKYVASQPFNISVIQISSPIIAPGIDVTNPDLVGPSPPPPAKSPAAKSPAEGPLADAPVTEDPLVAPVADVPVADAPVADAPVKSSPEPAAADTVTPSSGSRSSLGMGLAVVMGLILSSFSA